MLYPAPEKKDCQTKVPVVNRLNALLTFFTRWMQTPAMHNYKFCITENLSFNIVALG